MAVGGEVSIGGAVGDDLYAAGGNVQLDAIVHGNARVAGGDVTVGPATRRGRGAVAHRRTRDRSRAMPTITCRPRAVRCASTARWTATPRCAPRNSRSGPARVSAAGSSIADRSSHEVSGGRRDRGRRRVPRGERRPLFRRRRAAGRWTRRTASARSCGSSACSVAAALFLLLLPGFAGEAAATIGRKPLQSLGLGLAILVCVPFVAVVLLITIIGIPLALLLMSLYLLVLFLGWVTTALFVAQRGTRRRCARASPTTPRLAAAGAAARPGARCAVRHGRSRWSAA